MALKPRLKDVLWMVPAVVLLLAVALGSLHYYRTHNPVEQLAFKARRVSLVDRVQLSLASASEAEKSAVLGASDQTSQSFADQARAATADAERSRLELGRLLKTRSTQLERDLFAQFSQFFVALKRIDHDLLGLAVKNTNLANENGFQRHARPCTSQEYEEMPGNAHYSVDLPVCGDIVRPNASPVGAGVAQREPRLRNDPAPARHARMN
ncbi:MAG TPA: hypothetical protein VGQ83_00945 [Polyangia bacterium]|jgi:hypothetical protein